MQRGNSIQLSAETLGRAIAALDTASGCLTLVANDRKPIDLEECRLEIAAAFDELAAIEIEHTGLEDD